MNGRCRCYGSCLEVDTPKSILDETEIDVFATALSDYDEREWYEDLLAKLWARYRIRMINSCDRDLWQQMLKDTLDDILLEMGDYLDAYYGLDAEERTDFITDTGKTTTEHENELLPDTPIADTDKYLSDRSKTVMTTEGARSKLYSLKFAYDERMDLVGEVARRCSKLFLNRWC